MIPFIDLNAQQERIKPQIDQAIARVLQHGNYIMGPEVKELESNLAEFVNAKHCIAVSNGTDALSMAMMALDVGPGDAVITTPFTFFATVETIMLRGATPVFADIERDSYNICPQQIESAIVRAQESGLNLKGIISVDLYGLPAEYQAINEIASNHGIWVIQDGAQAFGAVYHDRKTPCHGLIGTTSFFPAKPLGCYGDGGAVFTDDDQLAEIVRSVRVHGKGTDKYDNVRIGLNARMDTIQAAILIEKLKIYSDELRLRQSVAKLYQAGIEDINSQLAASQSIQVQHVPESSRSAWAQFVIQTPHRDKISSQLKEAGIPSVVYYRTPAHQLKACEHLPKVELPVSEQASKEILALPFYPYLEQSTIDQVISVIADCVLESRDLKSA